MLLRTGPPHPHRTGHYSHVTGHRSGHGAAIRLLMCQTRPAIVCSSARRMAPSPASPRSGGALAALAGCAAARPPAEPPACVPMCALGLSVPATRNKSRSGSMRKCALAAARPAVGHSEGNNCHWRAKTRQCRNWVPDCRASLCALEAILTHSSTRHDASRAAAAACRPEK
jgi:hypothetical protein